MSFEQKVLILEQQVLKLDARVHLLEQQIAELKGINDGHRRWVERNPPEISETEGSYYERYREDFDEPMSHQTFNELPNDHEIVTVFGGRRCWYKK